MRILAASLHSSSDSNSSASCNLIELTYPIDIHTFEYIGQRGDDDRGAGTQHVPRS